MIYLLLFKTSYKNRKPIIILFALIIGVWLFSYPSNLKGVFANEKENNLIPGLNDLSTANNEIIDATYINKGYIYESLKVKLPNINSRESTLEQRKEWISINRKKLSEAMWNENYYILREWSDTHSDGALSGIPMYMYDNSMLSPDIENAREVELTKQNLLLKRSLLLKASNSNLATYPSIFSKEGKYNYWDSSYYPSFRFARYSGGGVSYNGEYASTYSIYYPNSDGSLSDTQVYCGEHNENTVYGNQVTLVDKDIGDTSGFSYDTVSMTKTNCIRLRKLMWYGFHSKATLEADPARFNKLPKLSGYGYTDDPYEWGGCFVRFSLMISYLRSNCSENSSFKSYYDNTAIPVLDTLDNPPETFKVLAFADKEKPETQTVFVGMTIPKSTGKIIIKKSSSNKEITEGNSCYSIKGAIYTLYENENCTDVAKDINGNNSILTTDEVGSTNTLTLPIGVYWAKETKASKGYKIDKASYKVQITRDETYTLKVKEVPLTDILESIFVKEDSLGKIQGNGKLAEGEYKVSYYDGYYNQKNIPEKSKKTWIVKTFSDEDGKVKVKLNDKTKIKGDELYYLEDNKTTTLPLGTMVIKENKAPLGYLLKDKEGNDPTFAAQLIQTDNICKWESSSHNPEYSVGNKDTLLFGNDKIIRGGVRIEKKDLDLDKLGMNGTQGNGKLEDIQFEIVSRCDNLVFYDNNDNGLIEDNEWHKKGEVCAVIKTVKSKEIDAEGKSSYFASTNSLGLPYGEYSIRESKSSPSYLHSDKKERIFRIGYIDKPDGNSDLEDGAIVTSDIEGKSFLNEGSWKNKVIKGGVQVVKEDLELDKSEGIGGNNLSGIKFEIKNKSLSDVWIDENLDEKITKDEVIKPGFICKTIYSHWNDKVKKYTAETLEKELPFGTYEIKEVNSNEEYLLTDKSPKLFEIKEDGKIVTEHIVDNKNENLVFKNQVKRGDIHFVKIGDGNSKRMRVPFKITNLKTNESHLITTDENGEFYSKEELYKDDYQNKEDNSIEKENEDVSVKQSRNTNENDAFLKEETIEMSKCKKDTMLWFGDGEFGGRSTLKDDLGALPYGKYSLTELRSDTNMGYKLQEFTFDVYRNNHVINLGTITDDLENTYLEDKRTSTEEKTDIEEKNTIEERTVTSINEKKEVPKIKKRTAKIKKTNKIKKLKLKVKTGDKNNVKLYLFMSIVTLCIILIVSRKTDKIS
ncbi:MAG: prealbumin-like fold domain-containing protein [Lachnospiraceae bacterium]|nr:prealbumin-like fold domain-containing protein [Lachnospiraceae bacterium]